MNLPAKFRNRTSAQSLLITNLYFVICYSPPGPSGDKGKDGEPGIAGIAGTPGGPGMVCLCFFVLHSFTFLPKFFILIINLNALNIIMEIA